MTTEAYLWEWSLFGLLIFIVFAMALQLAKLELPKAIAGLLVLLAGPGAWLVAMTGIVIEQGKLSSLPPNSPQARAEDLRDALEAILRDAESMNGRTCLTSEHYQKAKNILSTLK